MIPRLYEFSTDINDFSHNGLGFFNQCVSCKVHEVLNGEYNLTMEILPTDRLAETVIPDLCILAKPNYTDPPQIFVISNIVITKDLITITANHIKSLFFNNMVLGDIEDTGSTRHGTPQTVVNAILQYEALINPQPFTFTSDINDEKDFVYGATETTFGEIFTNDRDGLLRVYGGDLYFNNFSVQLLEHRGEDAVDNKARYTIRYGVNLENMRQELSSENVYTHLLPYAKVPTLRDYTGDISTVKLYGTEPQTSNHLIRINPDESAFTRILPVDFSKKFTKKAGYVDPSATSLAGTHYPENCRVIWSDGLFYADRHEKISMSTATITVNYESNVPDFEKYQLGDVVRVINSKMNYNKLHRVVETTYDCLNNRYEKVTIGDRKLSFYTYLKEVLSR